MPLYFKMFAKKLCSKFNCIPKVSWKVLFFVTIVIGIFVVIKFSYDVSNLRKCSDKTTFNRSLFKQFLKFLISNSNLKTRKDEGVDNKDDYDNYTIDYDYAVTELNNGTESTNTENTKNQCKPEPPIDDVSKCGNRIADKKCCEYISSLKYKDDLLERHDCHSSYSVAGGSNTQKGEFPHMAAVGFKLKTQVKIYKFLCGGSLISDQFVLTAGHCTDQTEMPEYEPKPYIVRMGAENISEVNNSTKDYRISNIIPHEKYRSPEKYYDVALLKLLNKVIFTYAIHPACLSTKLNPQNMKLNVTGWGVINGDTETMTDHLQVATVDIINRNDCNHRLEKHMLYNGNFRKLRFHQICAGVLEGGIDSCQGDSGGPLQERIDIESGNIHRIVGVVSFGYGCAVPGIPAVYISVSSVVSWIERIVWPEYKDTFFEGF